MRYLSQENRTQIDLLRRMKQEHVSELNTILRQNKSEAARDMARLRLAEKIIQEKDHDLAEVSFHAESASHEVEVLREELITVKSKRASSPMLSSREENESPSFNSAKVPIHYN